MLRSVLASSSCIVGRTSGAHCRRPFAATPTPGPANAAPHAAAAAAAAGSSTTTSFWQRWTAPRPEHAPNSAAWFAEKILQCGVFGAAGTSSMYLIRPVLPLVGFSSTSILDMTWPEKFASVLIMSPLYSLVLLSVATLVGRYAFFRPFFIRIWKRVPGVGDFLDKRLP